MQALGYGIDAVWHGLLSPGVEPRTTDEMARHLITVHLPLYVGAASVLASTTTALVRHLRRSATGLALPIAFVGSLLSAGAEAWHAASHLRLDTRSGPVAGTLGFIGFVVVLAAMWSSSNDRRRRATEATTDRRAV